MNERKLSSFSPIFGVIHSGRDRGVVTQGQVEVKELDILYTCIKIKEAASLLNVCGISWGLAGDGPGGGGGGGSSQRKKFSYYYVLTIILRSME
jgi:hypothetical protein